MIEKCWIECFTSLSGYIYKIQIAIRYDHEFYNNFCGLNVPEEDTECASVTVIFIVSLLVYKNK